MQINKNIKVKILIALIFLFHSTIYACEVCSINIPEVSVDAKITYNKERTFFDIKWKFHREFVSTLYQYDLNENSIYEDSEKDMIKENLIEYLQRYHYLTDIEYKNIKKLENSNFLQTIKLSQSSLEFSNETMIYHYKFSLPLVLQNNHSIYLGFNDTNDNFNFSINNTTLNNYPHSYSLEKNVNNIKINLNDSSIIQEKEAFSSSEKTNKLNTKETITEPQETTFIEILSRELTSLKESLKSTLKDIKENNSISSYILLLVFSFLYGILHAIGPGHGKSLVASYFVSEDKSYVKAFMIASLIGVVHTFSAFVLTLVVYYSIGVLFNSTILNVEQVATKVSAVIIILIALFLIYKKIKNNKKKLNFKVATKQSFIKVQKNSNLHNNKLSCGCNACKTTSTDLGVILAAGIIPCPGTVTIFIFTMSLGIFYVGFLSAVFMSLGMSLIIFITAILSSKIRKTTTGNKNILILFEYGSLFFILLLGMLLLLAS